VCVGGGVGRGLALIFGQNIKGSNNFRKFVSGGPYPPSLPINVFNEDHLKRTDRKWNLLNLTIFCSLERPSSDRLDQISEINQVFLCVWVWVVCAFNSTQPRNKRKIEWKDIRHTEDIVRMNEYSFWYPIKNGSEMKAFVRKKCYWTNNMLYVRSISKQFCITIV